MPSLKSIATLVFASTALLSSCGGTPHSSSPAIGIQEPAASAQPQSPSTLTIVGTSDLHGHIEMLPIFGGYLRILRRAKERAVLLVDGGDMFQGTLASNLEEGAPIVQAYNLLRYDAATIGNHEFDFGPVGEDTTVRHTGQDRRGALKARAAEANFPFLSSNIYDRATGAPIAWPNVRPSLLLTKQGVTIGIIGVSTFETPHVTLPANFEGLTMAPLAERIAMHARKLREAGAQAIIVAAHAGGHCEDFSDPLNLSSCEPGQEIMEVASALPAGSVDVIVAGHTHLGMAHQVAGIAIIESFSRGKSFGRVDLSSDSDGTYKVSKIYAPRSLCLKGNGPSCAPGEYQGFPVVADPALIALADQAGKIAEKIRSRQIGVSLRAPILRSRSDASALGNLFVDLMRAAQPDADLAITNGGSLRADLPSGPLLYGALFEAMPFDNRFALVRLRGDKLRKLFATNLRRDNGILSVSGLKVQAICAKDGLHVSMTRPSGKAVRDDEILTLATSDFLASGGDGLIGTPGIEAERVTLDSGVLIRDALAEQLGKREGPLDTSTFFSTDKPRIEFDGLRPLHCP